MGGAAGTRLRQLPQAEHLLPAVLKAEDLAVAVAAAAVAGGPSLLAWEKDRRILFSLVSTRIPCEISLVATLVLTDNEAHQLKQNKQNTDLVPLSLEGK